MQYLQQESNNSLWNEYLSYKDTSKQYSSEFKTVILVCWIYGLDWVGPGQRQVADACECGNEL